MIKTISYKSILHFFGYSLYLDSGNDHQNPLQIGIISTSDNDNVFIPMMINNSENKLSCKSYLKLYMKYMYNALIFSLISWSFIFSIMLSILNHDFNCAGQYSFQLIFSIQYIIGIWYFNDSHFFDTLKIVEKLKNQLKIALPIAIILAIIISIGAVVIAIHNISLSEGTVMFVFYKEMTPLLAVVIFAQSFFSYATFLINTTAFVLIVLHHKNDIASYAQKINIHISSQVTLINTITTANNDISKMNIDFEKSVEKLNWFFSSLSVLGIINIFLITKFLNSSGSNLNYIDILNISLFIIVEYTYISFAQKLRYSIEDISANIQRPMRANNYLKRSTSEKKFHNTQQVDNFTIYEAVIDMSINVTEISEYFVWGILKDTLSVKWANFEFFGIQIDDTSLTQKLFGGIITLLIAKNIISSSFA